MFGEVVIIFENCRHGTVYLIKIHRGEMMELFVLEHSSLSDPPGESMNSWGTIRLQSCVSTSDLSHYMAIWPAHEESKP